MTDYTDSQHYDYQDQRKRRGSGLGLAVILAGFFWAGVIVFVVI